MKKTILVLFLFGSIAPSAWAIEGHCVAYCGGSGSSSSSSSSGYSYGSYDYSGYAAAGQALGEALGDAMYNALSGIGQAFDKMIQDEIRRKQAWQAARKKHLERLKDEWQRRAGERSERESRHYAELSKAAERMGLIIGGLRADLTQPATVVQDFQFLKPPAKKKYSPIEERYRTLRTVDVPSPKPPAPKKPPVQLKKLEDYPQMDGVIDFTNQAFKQWAKAQDWAEKKFESEVKGRVIGALEAQSKAFSYVKGLKDRFDHLDGIIGGEHKRTVTGLFEGMRQGAYEAGSTRSGGTADEEMEQFWRGRGDAYDKMAKDEMKSIGKGKLKELKSKPQDPLAFQKEKSTTTPLLGLKSFARQSAEARRGR